MVAPRKPPAKGKAAELQPVPDVEVGDQVYFRHPEGGPKVGKISAFGRAGCHVDCEGRRLKVKWEHMLGHKERIQPAYTVMDQGEDGMILQEPGGRKRYIHDPDTKSEFVAKSAMPRALIFGDSDLIMKAIKNAPGLALQGVTDKAGHQTKRWKRTTKDQPKERPRAAAKTEPGRKTATVKFKVGDKVSFGEGSGQIVGKPGADGAYVKDDSGELHQVHWKDMGEAKADAGGAGKKTGGGGGGVGGGDDGGDGDKPEEPKKPDYAPRKEGESDKDYAKRAIDTTDPVEKLPEDASRYFELDNAVAIPISEIKSSKTDEENKKGGDNGPKRMLAAYHGALGKRDPIKVTPNPDGTYSVVDGNGTLTAAKKMGWQALPTWVVQPQDTEDAVYHAAEEANQWLATWLNKGKGVCDQLKYTTMPSSPEEVPDSGWSKPGGMLFLAPLKARGEKTRSAEKVRDSYDGDWSRIKDIARCTVAVDTIPQLHEMLDHLHTAGMVVAQPMKDRYNGNPTEEGYRDINIVVRAPNGHLVEVQVNTKVMMQAKNAGHPYYDVSRKISDVWGDKPPETWPKDLRQKYLEAQAVQQRLYTAAYAKVKSGGTGAVDSSAGKSDIEGGGSDGQV